PPRSWPGPPRILAGRARRRGRVVAAHHLHTRGGARQGADPQLHLVVQRRLIAREQCLERLLVQNRDAELLGLAELRPRALTDDDVAGLLRNARRHFAAARTDLVRRFVARALLQRAGEDERQPRERRVDRLALGTAVALEIHTGGAQPLHQAPVAINREPRADALPDCGS